MNDKLRITIKAICLLISAFAATATNQQVAVLFDTQTLAFIKLMGSVSLVLVAFLDKGIANIQSVNLLSGIGTLKIKNSEEKDSEK
jgi:hypothetical protein